MGKFQCGRGYIEGSRSIGTKQQSWVQKSKHLHRLNNRLNLLHSTSSSGAHIGFPLLATLALRKQPHAIGKGNSPRSTLPSGQQTQSTLSPSRNTLSSIGTAAPSGWERTFRPTASGRAHGGRSSPANSVGSQAHRGGDVKNGRECRCL